MTLADQGHVEIDGARLEYRMIGPLPDAAPTIFMLHEGLGSVSTWGKFPSELAEKTGAGVFAYSRAGYGQSSTITLPRPLDYMQREAANVLPKLLDAIGFRRGILLGHSDGASIAAQYAGTHQDHRVRGLVLMAPHFFVEAEGLAEIRNARIAYETTDLRARLARHHADVDAAFRGWNEAWLDPGFARAFDITEALAYIRVPVLLMQGEADRYGTLAQVRAAQEECYCPVDTLVMPGVGHAPHREKPDETVAAIASFADRIFPPARRRH
ncbi:MAG: alpha/beta hydrolase [Alphaproteobacteria bacterium]